MPAVTPSGNLVVAFRNDSDNSYCWGYECNPGASAMQFDGTAWAPLGRPFFGGPTYPQGFTVGMYGNVLGFGVGGETPYVSFRDGAGVKTYDGEQWVLALDRATGQWSAVGGRQAAQACGDFSFNSVAANANKVCAAFLAYRPGENRNCDLAVMCYVA